ncbi:hypothetical protein [Silvibacterium sp.]|uniref:hypothetical protein n=1 Tax=Silvibacterium sp. TaxID=1964179 RepID=UPI0039E724C7
MDLILHMAAYWLVANLAVVSYLIVLYSKHRVAEHFATNRRGLHLIHAVAGGKNVRAHQNVESIRRG